MLRPFNYSLAMPEVQVSEAQPHNEQASDAVQHVLPVPNERA